MQVDVLNTKGEKTGRTVELPDEIFGLEQPNDHVVYLARTDNYNGDNALDSDDPVYLYLTNKNGEGLKQITPKGLNVISWTISKDKKMILVKLKNDKNGNKKFGNGDDELYYRIDLEKDISKIKCYEIGM